MISIKYVLLDYTTLQNCLLFTMVVVVLLQIHTINLSKRIKRLETNSTLPQKETPLLSEASYDDSHM